MLDSVMKDILSAFKITHESIHGRKLHRLGIDNSLQPCDPNKVVFNLSSKTLPNRIKTLLAFGLDFKLPVWKLSFYDHFFFCVFGIARPVNFELATSCTVQLSKCETESSNCELQILQRLSIIFVLADIFSI